VVVHTYNPSYSGSRDRRGIGSRPAQAMLVRSYLKKKIKPKGLGSGRAAEHEVLGLIPSATEPNQVRPNPNLPLFLCYALLFLRNLWLPESLKIFFFQKIYHCTILFRCLIYFEFLYFYLP
jgi:hypothetical protein